MPRHNHDYHGSNVRCEHDGNRTLLTPRYLYSRLGVSIGALSRPDGSSQVRCAPVSRVMTPPASDTLTHVELIWFEKRIEQWIRFGHDAAEQILDRRRVLTFTPGSIFACVR